MTGVSKFNRKYYHLNQHGFNWSFCQILLKLKEFLTWNILLQSWRSNAFIIIFVLFTETCKLFAVNLSALEVASQNGDKETHSQLIRDTDNEENDFASTAMLQKLGIYNKHNSKKYL